MDMKPVLVSSSLCELNEDEIGQVSGGVFFVAPVVIKIGAWALGAGFGAGMVYVLSRVFAK